MGGIKVRAQKSKIESFTERIDALQTKITKTEVQQKSLEKAKPKLETSLEVTIIIIIIIIIVIIIIFLTLLSHPQTIQNTMDQLEKENGDLETKLNSLRKAASGLKLKFNEAESIVETKNEEMQVFFVFFIVVITFFCFVLQSIYLFIFLNRNFTKFTRIPKRKRHKRGLNWSSCNKIMMVFILLHFVISFILNYIN